jgi:hypothetical protein
MTDPLKEELMALRRLSELELPYVTGAATPGADPERDSEIARLAAGLDVPLILDAKHRRK